MELLMARDFIGRRWLREERLAFLLGCPLKASILAIGWQLAILYFVQRNMDFYPGSIRFRELKDGSSIK